MKRKKTWLDPPARKEEVRAPAHPSRRVSIADSICAGQAANCSCFHCAHGHATWTSSAGRASYSAGEQLCRPFEPPADGTQVCPACEAGTAGLAQCCSCHSVETAATVRPFFATVATLALTDAKSSRRSTSETKPGSNDVKPAPMEVDKPGPSSAYVLSPFAWCLR